MNFQIEHRTALHEPIDCEVRFFHYASSMILKRTLEAMELVLGEELSGLMLMTALSFLSKNIPNPDHCSLNFINFLRVHFLTIFLYSDGPIRRKY